jgi:D-hexose-6-phosphate mutarotase
MITKKERAPGITVVTLANAAATAEISLYGGHILSYRPAGKDDILFMSDKAVFETGKPIRGGIPVCWPWFGPHAADKTLPAHGFVRTMNWKIVGEEDGESHSGLTLECTATAETKALWPHEFKVTIAFFVGKTLSIALTTENTGDEPFDFTDALHTYFRVGDIAKTTVVGFDGSEYVDRTVQPRVKGMQTGDITIAKETDSVYLRQAACVIEDKSTGREITINPQLFPDAVVWNPWADRAKAIADLGDDEYKNMICVEAGSVLENTITVDPGTSVLQCLQIIPGA